jgi:hypothetical protein
MPIALATAPTLMGLAAADFTAAGSLPGTKLDPQVHKPLSKRG